MSTLLLFICFLASGHLGTERQFPLTAESRDKPQEQSDASTTAVSCEDILTKALVLNESFKRAVSAGGEKALGLEVERYYNTVLLEKISGCVTYAYAHSDAALAKLVFELAYSYFNSANEVIPLELARFYSRDQEMTKTILLNYEKSKRNELIEILKWGLDKLYFGKSEEASRLTKLKHLLDALESD